MQLAITHVPSSNLADGLRTHVARIEIDQSSALQQHREYCRTLERLGAEVITLDVNPLAPDAVFIEDTAIVLDEVAILTSMGKAARRAEPDAVEPVLRKYRQVEKIVVPALIEGGDVLRLGRMLLVGVSSRTNQAGFDALEGIVSRYGYRVTPVPVRGCLHLKTACTGLPDGALLVNREWLDLAAIADLETISVPGTEPWGANTLTLNGTVVLADEHRETADLLRRRGYNVEAVALSEFAKAEGGVTCLSLVFSSR